MLSGIILPAVTPFDEQDEVDEQALKSVVRFLLSAGVHGLAVCGSTGEGHTLSPEETRQITSIAAEEVEGKIFIIVGIIANSTRQALQHARAVKDLPIAALMVTPPHYLFTPNEDEMFAYFRTIAEETGFSVLVYNVVPWSYLSAEALISLMAETPCQGVKADEIVDRYNEQGQVARTNGSVERSTFTHCHTRRIGNFAKLRGEK